MRAFFSIIVLMAALLISGPQAVPAPSDPGKLVFDNVCATCHSEQPPAKLAPPMSHVIRHYRTELGSDEAIRAAITDWIVNPTPEMSLLPEHAIERFGLMAGITTLSEQDTHDVISYIMTLQPDTTKRMQMRMNMPDSAGMRMGNGRMNH